MGALRFEVDDTVSLAPGATAVNAGTSAYTFRVHGTINALPASGLVGLIGTSSTTTSNGLVITSAGALRIYTAGTNRYGSSNGLITAGVLFDFTVDHESGGAWNITDNLTSTVVASGTFTTSTGFATINQFGRSSSNNANYLYADMEIFEITSSSLTEVWEADLSGGTGTTLPTVSGNNQGTLVNFDVPACWVGFSSGAIEFASSSYSTSYSQSNFLTAIDLASTSYSTSLSTSDIVAGAINFASMSYSTSLAFSSMATQIRFLSDSRSTSSSISDLANDTPVFDSYANSTSRSQSQLNTAIHFASSVKSTSISYSNLTEESIAKYLKRWDGLNFNSHPLERWDGSMFKRHPLMRWDGDQWIQYNG